MHRGAEGALLARHAGARHQGDTPAAQDVLGLIVTPAATRSSPPRAGPDGTIALTERCSPPSGHHTVRTASDADNARRRQDAHRHRLDIQDYLLAKVNDLAPVGARLSWGPSLWYGSTQDLNT
jgi:hypothetical protein